MRLLALAVTAAAVLLAGCGEDEKKEKPAGPLSKQEYQRQGNSICRRSEAASERLPDPKGPDELDETFARLLKIVKPYNVQFAKLEPPAALKSAHEDAIEDNRAGERYLKRLTAELRDADDPIATFKAELPKLAKLIDRGNALARKLGLKDCVADVPAPGAEQSPSPS